MTRRRSHLLTTALLAVAVTGLLGRDHGPVPLEPGGFSVHSHSFEVGHHAGHDVAAVAAADAPLGARVTDQAPGGRAVAHRAGGVPIRSKAARKNAPRAILRPTGTQAAEPTMAFSEDGTMFFVGTDGPALESPFGLVPQKIEWPVMRSEDDGKSWTDVSPKLGPQRRHAMLGLDPMIHLDPDTGRLFTADLQLVLCGTISFSDDKGQSWLTSEACGVADHQTLFTGPPVVSPTVGYPNVVYYCAIDGGALANFGTMTSCLKSLDGGVTWARTGQPAFRDDPDQDGGQMGIPGHCGGATGHGVADEKGWIYLPRGWCGQPYLAISKDEGATWTRVQVADNGMPFNEGAELDEHEAGVAVDAKGNIYYVWTAKDRLFYLATSTDGGTTFSKPKMIAPPGVTETWGPAIAVGDPGKIAVAYIGSTNAPGGEGAQGTGPEYEESTWDGYITMTGNALADNPLYYSGTVNAKDDPLTIGGCAIGRCDARIYDFLDVQIAPDGQPWAAMVASYSAKGELYRTWGTGFVGSLAGGPRLRAEDKSGGRRVPDPPSSDKGVASRDEGRSGDETASRSAPRAGGRRSLALGGGSALLLFTVGSLLALLGAIVVARTRRS